MVAEPQRQLGNDTTTTQLGNYIRVRFRHNKSTTSDAESERLANDIRFRSQCFGSILYRIITSAHHQYCGKHRRQKQHQEQDQEQEQRQQQQQSPAATTKLPPRLPGGDGQPLAAGTHLHPINHTTTTTTTTQLPEWPPGRPPRGNNNNNNNTTTTTGLRHQIQITARVAPREATKGQQQQSGNDIRSVIGRVSSVQQQQQ